MIPTPAELNAVPSLETPANPGWQSNLQLPANLPPQIGQIAQRVTAGAVTPYEKVMAIQEYLRDNFTYDLHVPAPRSANDLVYFLTKSHRGYCEQFAGTMAVMLRTLGIPARVALGFTPGSYDGATQAYRVGTQDSHAWVEVEFPQYGWLAFEPTPTRDNPTASAYDTPPAVVGGNRSCQTTGALRGVPCTPGAGGVGRTGGSPGRNLGPLGRLRHERNGGGFAGLPPLAPRPVPLATRIRHAALLVLLAGIVLALALIPPAKAVRRRLRVRSGEPRTRVIGAFRLFDDHAADVGLGRRPYETPSEYGRRIAEACPAAAEPIAALAAATARATYGGGAVTSQQADEAVRLARTAAHEVSISSPWPRRLAGAYRLGWWNPGGRWVAPAQPAPVRRPTLLRV